MRRWQICSWKTDGLIGWRCDWILGCTVILVQQLKIRHHLQFGENLPFGFLILIFPPKTTLWFWVGLQQKTDGLIGWRCDWILGCTVILVQQLKIRRHLQLGENLPFGFLILIFFPWNYVMVLGGITAKAMSERWVSPRSLCALKRLRKLITKLIKENMVNFMS